MRGAALMLLALCLYAPTITLSAAQNDALLIGRAVPEVHLRALREQDAVDKPTSVSGEEPTTVVEANRALHRVYDPVTGLYCELVGDCHACPASEKDEVYCRDTGHQQELLCSKADTTDKDAPKERKFSSCTPVEKTVPVLRVITFEIIMAVVLAGAYTLLQKERRKHMSSFDVRKDAKQQRGALLGDKNHD